MAPVISPSVAGDRYGRGRLLPIRLPLLPHETFFSDPFRQHPAIYHTTWLSVFPQKTPSHLLSADSLIK